EEGIGYERFERAIRQVMTYYMGFVRNQRGMETALERLNFIEGHADQLHASNYRELMRTTEAMHLLKTCRLSTLATMERKESGRAIYRRSDYPDRSDEYNRTLAIWQENEAPRISWQ
ncbi:MAG: FAD-binding protein, partial [Pseudomonadota bacterium]